MRHKKRLLCLLLALVLTASVFTAYAATGKLESNTGRRHVTCTALSAQANAYYTGVNTWEKLSALSGVNAPTDSWLAAQNNPLYDALHKLMSDTQTKSVSYQSLPDSWSNTDTSADAKSYVFFYGDIDSSGSGYTMNREHIWCKSSASFFQLGGGCDLHHLRPSISFVNQAKGSLAFGNVKGKYSDATATKVNGTEVCWSSSSRSLFEVKDNVKGDVARILLYVYCRWGQPNLYSDVEISKLPAMDKDDDQNFGKKVVENLDVLLDWMRRDPVDEWEMGRNDQVENVQGNRNVFIDYPELAWLMFGRAVPSDMPTPSGKAMYENHNWDKGMQSTASTCTEPGLMTYSCTDCDAVRTVVIPAAGHNYVGGRCTVCGDQTSLTCYVRANELSDGDEVVFFYPEGGRALSCVLMGSNYLSGEAVTPDGKELYTDRTNIVWQVKQTDGGFELRSADGKLLTASSSSYYLNYSNPDTVWTVTPAKTQGCLYLKNKDGKCVEWVANYSDFGAYNYSASYENVLAMQLYMKQQPEVCPTVDYTDVPAEDNWAHAGIDYAVAHGIMGSTRTDALTFEPASPCTRAMIVSVLYRLEGSPATMFEGRFSDVPAGKWYSTAVVWAYKNGIVQGYENGNFGPNDYVTREQFALIMKAYAELRGVDTSARADISGFPDESKCTWSRNAVCWAVAVKLISGKASGGVNYLDPKGKATRAEVASILMRFMKNILDY